MIVSLPVRAPFDFAQTRAFMGGFAPCRGDVIVDGDGVLGAHLSGDRAVAWRLGPGPSPASLHLALAGAPTAPAAADVARQVAAFVGADDDLADFYRRAAGDHPAFRALVAAFHGLHHVRFPSLAEVTCYAILSQRTPMTVAVAHKRRLAATFGVATAYGAHRLTAFPSFAMLRTATPGDLTTLLRHPTKAARLHGAIAAVDELGEAFLRTAPYAQAAAALRAIPGIGPFSVAMILLRGLGRTDHLDPRTEPFATIGRDIYGDGWDPAAIERRYGPTIGTWAYYLRVGEARAVRACAA